MILARVKGTVVATMKDSAFIGHKVLVVQPLDEEGEEIGQSFLAVDAMQAGEGDCVLVSREGNAAKQVLENPNAPFHSVILGIVDAVELNKE